MNLSRIALQLRWRTLLWLSIVALALTLAIRADLGQLRWVSDLTAQGSPPPARDKESPTGYVLGQRHFLGKFERGETYRWIAATQDLVRSGPFGLRTYESDTVPTGRPQLLPKLYASWLAAVAWGVHVVTGEPVMIAIEQAALWEPVVLHVLAFAAAVVFMGRRYGLASAAAAAVAFAFLPTLFGQFLPGTLTARTWAMLLAAYAVARCIPATVEKETYAPLTVLSAIAASLALWLDPACGFPAVLLMAAAGGTAIFALGRKLPILRWSLVGSGLTLAAWFVDRTPWAATAGELRYVHPSYALAWLGIGLGLDGAQRLRSAVPNRKWAIGEIVGAISLISVLGYIQVKHEFQGWFYPSVWMRRIASMDDTRAFGTFLDWLREMSAAEALFLSAPAIAAIAALAAGFLAARRPPVPARRLLAPAAVVFAGLLALAFFRVRWSFVVSLVSLPLIALLVRDVLPYRRVAVGLAGAFLVGLVLWIRFLPAALERPTAGTEVSATDVEALLYRHFAHWLASHTPGQKVAALAPPELSDSIVFHGGGHVLISTAWESYPGQLAARRILSSLESSEAEAVIQGHELTHLILPSWDKILPLFVQTPMEKGRDTLFDRLDRWNFPAYLRPIPYHPPAIPELVGQKMPVYKVVFPQDEPLLLSRLAEYFVEMERAEPAGLVAGVLARAYPDDPNAAIGRATVYAHAKRSAEFEQELARLAADTEAGRAPFSWDRRVQRAIMLALGKKNELARSEVEACLDTVTEADLLELTPLQAYRLTTLASALRLQFRDRQLADIAVAIGAEYRPNQG